METGCSLFEASNGTGLARQVHTVSARDTSWRHALPVLSADGLILREVRQDDASPLLAMLATDDVSRFMSPLPPTLDSFGRFVAWNDEQRTAGQSVCFVVVPEGIGSPVGVFQMRSLEAAFVTAEWGFALGSPFWGSGLFARAARLVLDFAFGTLGRAAPRGARVRREPPRERCAPQARRYARGRAAAILPLAREVPRPGALVDPRLRLDRAAPGGSR